MQALQRNNWPANRIRDIRRFYGNEGENQCKLDTPYPVYLAWQPDKYITRFTCHEKVADSLYRIMQRTLDYYGIDEIQRLRIDEFSGCLNVRKARGKQWISRHSFGCAVDWLYTENRLKQPFEDSAFSHPDYDEFLNFYEYENWLVGGRRWGRDACHFQATQ